MKKIFTLFLALIATTAIWAQDAKQYYIQEKTSGLYVGFDESYTSAGETNVKNAVFLVADPYSFDVVETEEGFLISAEVNGETWTVAQSSKMGWNFSNTGETYWTAVDAGDGLVKFQGPSGYWKIDGTTVGKYLYTDASASAASKFALFEVNDNFVDCSALEAELNHAKNLVIGDMPFMHYQGLDAETWETAKATAQYAYDLEDHTQSIVDMATNVLKSMSSKLVMNLPDPAQWYALKHVESGLYLNLDNGGAYVLDEPTPVMFEADGDTYGIVSADYVIGTDGNGNVSITMGEQFFTIVASAPEAFSLQSDIEGYDCFGCIYRTSGSYEVCSYDTHPASTNSQWQVELADAPVAVGSVQSATTAPVIYNLTGQRISTLQQGVNIVNGKKVIF